MMLTEVKAELLLKPYAAIAKNVLTKNLEEAVHASQKIGFPLFIKIISPQAIHKTDIGGVRKAHDLVELKQAFDALERVANRHKLKVEGFLVQEAVQGTELIAGLKHDEVFGPVIMLGMGGIFVEVFKEVTFRKCPITAKDVKSMLNELPAKKLLEGARGTRKVNIAALTRTLINISKMPRKHKIKELDINPLIVNERGAFVCDARILL